MPLMKLCDASVSWTQENGLHDSGDLCSLQELAVQCFRHVRGDTCVLFSSRPLEDGGF